MGAALVVTASTALRVFAPTCTRTSTASEVGYPPGWLHVTPLPAEPQRVGPQPWLTSAHRVSMITTDVPTADLCSIAVAAFDFALETPLSRAREHLFAASPGDRDQLFRYLHAAEASLRRVAHAAATLSVRELVQERYPDARHLQLRQHAADPYDGFHPVALFDSDGAALWTAAPLADDGDLWGVYLDTACANLTDADGVLNDPAGSPALAF